VKKPELHRGKIATPPRILSVRVLTREDLGCLKGEKRVAPRVKAFRDTHHRLARLCAAGLRNEEILRITGYSGVRLSTLKLDPAFQQLIAEYRGKVDAAYVQSQDEFFETATSNMLRAERQVEDHLDRADDEGELIPLKTLLAITADRADRFGYSKKTINTNINLDFAKRMEQMMASRGQATVIDAKASPSHTTLASTPQESSASEGPKSASIAQLEQCPTSMMDVGESPTRGAKSVAASAGFRRRM